MGPVITPPDFGKAAAAKSATFFRASEVAAVLEEVLDVESLS
jgi:hypothetical protein